MASNNNSMTPADGGAAFPAHDSFGDPTNGMSLRDWFAGQALAGCLASGKWHNSGTGFEEYIAVHAYNIADAMLAERAK